MKLPIIAAMFLSLIWPHMGSATAQESDRESRMERRRQMQQRLRGQNNRRRRGNNDNGSLKVGDLAPVFKLNSLDGKSETDLESFKGKKPVVLLFGSYT